MCPPDTQGAHKAQANGSEVPKQHNTRMGECCGLEATHKQSRPEKKKCLARW